MLCKYLPLNWACTVDWRKIYTDDAPVRLLCELGDSLMSYSFWRRELYCSQQNSPYCVDNCIQYKSNQLNAVYLDPSSIAMVWVLPFKNISIDADMAIK